MYDAGRLTHPLKRIGKRGEGKWKRITWDEALNEVADKFIDVITTDGPGAISWDPYQFKQHKSYGALTPSPFNPLSLAGGYFHLQPLPEANTPGPSDRNTRVEIEEIAVA